jgi:hypothetical protein
MLKLGIIAEGLPNSDVIIISELVKKILLTNPLFILRAGRSKPNVINKYRGWLEDFRNRNIDKALIMIDQDMSCVRALVEKLKEKISDREYRFSIKYHIIEREIETWLLADERAISNIAGRNVHRINETLEDILQPKEKLIEILSRARVNCTAETKRRIAAESDIKRIAYRCPGFRRFQQSVIDC